jgi:hypothetical protein
MLPFATEVYGDRLGEEQSIGYYTLYRRWLSWAQLGSAWLHDCESIRPLTLLVGIFRATRLRANKKPCG